MKKTKIMTVVLCLILALASVGFVACENKTHNFDTAWTYNETDHWHKCKDKDCTEISDKAPHNFVNGVCECGKQSEVNHTPATAWTYDETDHWHKCSENGCSEIFDKAPHDYVDGVCVCGKIAEPEKPEISAYDALTAFISSLQDMENSKGYNVCLKDLKGSVKGVTISNEVESDDNENQEQETKETANSEDDGQNEDDNTFTIPVNVSFTANIEFFASKDAEGKLSVNGRLVLSAIAEKATDDELFTDFADTVSTINLDVTFVVKDGLIYYAFNYEEDYAGIPEKLRGEDFKKSNIADSNKFASSNIIQEICTKIGQNIDEEDSSQIVLNIAAKVLPVATKMLKDQFSPTVEAINGFIKDLFTLNKSEINETLKSAFNTYFTATENENGYVITADATKISAVVKDACNLTITEFCNKYIAKDFVKNASFFAKLAITRKISTIIDLLSAVPGLDINEIVQAIDDCNLIGILWKSIFGTEQKLTVESLLSIPEDMTVKEYIKALIGDKTIAEIIESSENFPEDKTVVGYIDEAAKYANENTILQLIEKLSKQEGIADMKDMIITMSDNMVASVLNVFKFELKLTKAFAFESFTFDVNLTDDTVNLVKAMLLGLGGSEDKLANISVNLNAKLSVSIGEFKNELKFDYDKLVNDIDAKNPTEAEKEAA